MEIDGLSYTYDVEALATGASFGNAKLFVRTDARSNLLGAWSASDNQWYCGPLRFRFTVNDIELEPMVTRFFPAYQETIYGIEGIVLSHRVFVPYASGYERAVCWLLEVQAEGPRLVEIAVDIYFSPAAQPDLEEGLAFEQREKRIDIRLERGLTVAQTVPTYYSALDETLGRAKEVRVFGTTGPPTVHLYSEPGRAQLLYHVLVEGYYDLPYVLGVSPAGEHVAWHGFLALSEITAAFQDTQKRADRWLDRCRLYTPDPAINRGIEWAKIGLLRGQQRFRRGPVLLHDPPGDVITVRDVAWRSLGSTYVDPETTGEGLRYVAAEAGYETGRLADHFAASTGEREDFGLNINDATPLLVIAAHHHYMVSQDDAFLDAIYDAVRGAADYIVLQVEGGLVQCQAEGTNVYGVAGWRNRIPGYTLNGAVTEINALSIWALRAAAALAERRERTAHAGRWSAVADELAANLNQTLVSETTGVYLLARDRLGHDRSTLTGDLVWPILAGAASPTQSERTLDLLHGALFWTDRGVRTVAVNEPAYHPASAGGRLGGISAPLTAWVAYAGRQRYRAHVAEALHNLYALVESPIPVRHGEVVPGQLPSWLDAETGATLDRGFSATSAAMYLWLGLEGLAGLAPDLDGLAIEPALPDDWGWLAAAAVPYAGANLAFCCLDGVLHVSQPVHSSMPVEVYDAIEPVAGAPGFALLLSRNEQQHLFVATAEDPVDATIPAGGREWRVALAPGEVTLLSEPMGD
jgi:hypothetical protein